VVCWGYNHTRQTDTPQVLTSGALAVAAGFEDTCGIDSFGRLHCWGDNADQQGDIPEDAMV